MQAIQRLFFLMVMTAGILAMATGQAVAASAVPASASGVTEYTVEAKRIGNLAQASDGTVIYGSTVGSWDHLVPHLGQVGPNGPLGETTGPLLRFGGITTGTEGDIWAATYDQAGESWVSRSMAAGGWSRIEGTAGAGDITPRAAGGVWFVQREPRDNQTIDDVPKVGYVSATGAVTAFPISYRETGNSSIVEGHEGDVWFTEYFPGAIGRMSPTGELTEFPLRAGSRPASITIDGAGNFWFTDTEGSRVGRITPTGSITEFRLPQPVRPGQIAAGADGRLWFTEQVAYSESVGIGNLGRISPSGRFTQVELPDRESEPQDVIAGSDGDIWYTAIGERSCGGGGSCQMWEPKNPAIVGRIRPVPLTTAIAAVRTLLWQNRADVAISCGDGIVTEICKGSIAIEVSGKRVARSRYSVPIDSSRQVAVRRVAAVSSLLKATIGKRRALVVVRPDAARTSRRAVTVVRH